jgi:hypothetical protein
MITIKLNNEPHEFPTSWADVTYSQWVALMELPDNTMEYVSLFTGIPIDTLKKMQIIGLDSLLNALSFLNTKPEMPGSVLKCGKYPIPEFFNIQQESLGQFEDMRDTFKKMDNTIIGIIKSYKTYVAIYLQKIRDGVYDHTKVPSMEREVDSMPGMEVITLGSFFFLKLRSLSNGTPITFPLTKQSQKKKSLTRSTRTGGSMRRSTK